MKKKPVTKKPGNPPPARMFKPAAAAPADKEGNQFVLTVGGYSNMPMAERAVYEFMNTDIFRYQAVFYPNPQNFGITARVVAAKVVDLGKRAPSILEPYAIAVTFTADGDATKRAQWRTAMESRLRTRLIQ